MADLIENERIKLLAAAFDRASTACIAVGIVAPVAAGIYSFAIPTGGFAILAAGVVFWLFAAIALHWFARTILGRLQL